MSKPTNQPKATERLEGNRRPATLEIEYSDADLRLDIWIGPFDGCLAKEGVAHEVKCALTGKSFTVFKGQLVYHIDAAGDIFNGHLHPQTVVNGEEFIRERIRHKALLDRDSAMWRMMDAVRLEAIADRPIEIRGLKKTVK